jgi:hypothetical protein
MKLYQQVPLLTKDIFSANNSSQSGYTNGHALLATQPLDKQQLGITTDQPCTEQSHPEHPQTCVCRNAFWTKGYLSSFGHA